MRDTLEALGVWLMVTAIFAAAVFVASIVIDIADDLIKTTPVTQEWIKEDVVCFMQGERVVNC